MPRKRVLRRRYKRRRARKSYGASANSGLTKSKVVTFPMTRLSNSFPERLRTRLRFVYADGVTTGVTNQTLTFKGNSCILCGPRVNNAGAFTANYPTSLAYLLGSNTGATDWNSLAPYGNCRVRSSKITVRAIANAGNNTNCCIVILPTENLTIPAITSATLGNSLLEQPNVKFKQFMLTESKALVVTNKCDTNDVYGIPEVLTKIPDFAFPYNADPANVWYWQVVIFSTSAANQTTTLNVIVDYDVEFFNVNNLSTRAPA